MSEETKTELRRNSTTKTKSRTLGRGCGGGGLGKNGEPEDTGNTSKASREGVQRVTREITAEKEC